MAQWPRTSVDKTFTYVGTAQPVDAEEGETWYDTDADEAFVYDGGAWIEMSVTDHAQLSGITADAHHTKPTSTQTASDAGRWLSWAGGPVNAVVSGVRVYNGSSDGRSASISGAGIPSWSGTVSGNSWYEHTFSSRATTDVSISTSGTNWSREIRLAPVAPHSHTI